ncbi:MAG: SagB/ThcOx family dehydrogenase, partial [Acidobacteriota bacterium]
DALVDFYERALPAAEAKADAAPATAEADPYAEWYEILFDEDERDRFKAEKRWRRQLDGDRVAIALDGDAPEDTSAWDARRTIRRFSQEPLPLTDLAGLLGVLRVAEVDGATKWRYASAGSAYPVQTYLHVKDGRIDGLAGGSYYYDPVEHRLVAIQEGAELERSIHGFINWSIFEQGAFSVFFVADIAAIGPLYGPVAKDYCYIEAGLICQALEAAAPDHSLGLCQLGVGGVDLEPVAPIFELGDSHLIVHSAVGGGLDPTLSNAEASEAAPIFDDEWEEGEL